MNDREHSSFPAILEGEIGGTVVQTVNARDLHAALGIGKDFSTWIKDRIGGFGFNENSDFIMLPEIGEQTFQGVRTRLDYHLTLDMAKELAMVERNEAGKRVRAYFIDCERKLRERPAEQVIPDFSDPVVLLGAFTHLHTQVQAKDRIIHEQAERMEEMQPKVEALDRIAEAHGSFNRTTAAKMLGVPPQTLMRWMVTNGWTYKRPGTRDDLAYQSKIASGYLEHKITTGPRTDGTEWSATQVRVTPRGMTALARAFPPVAQEAKPSRRSIVAGIGALAAIAAAVLHPGAKAQAADREALTSAALAPSVESRENHAIMRIKGETLLVDLARLDCGHDDRVVCFDAAGELTVEPVRMAWPHQNWQGRRHGFVRDGRRFGKGAEHHPGVWVIGTVIGAAEAKDRAA